MSRTRRIVIIGAGPGGLCMGARLLQAGFEDFVIFEQADGVGGTWRHNSYPGAACDVPSHLYSFSFAPKRDWSRPYATQPEILEYFEQFVVRSGLESHLRLGTPVESVTWDDSLSRWRIRAGGTDLDTDVVIGAVGMFAEPVWPDIPGLDSFQGTVFHSARWNHAHDLAGRAVAVVGSGASAVQFVPEIAPAVARLHHFHRQPQWVLPKLDEPFTPADLERFRDDPAIGDRLRTEVFERVDQSITFSDPEARRQAEAAGLANLALVEDPVVRVRLTPSAPFGCHRPLISSVYYQTFNLPHVEVVTDPVEKVTSDAVVTLDGAERVVDTIILGTGFATTKYLSVIDVAGRDGLRLDQAWADGARAYLGVTTPGFPNLFMLYGPNTNNGSILHMIECQVGYILRQLDRMDAEGVTSLEVRADVVERYNERLQRDLDAVEVWNAGCHGYYRGPSGRIVTQWPHTMTEYARRTGRPDPDAYEARVTPSSDD